jgi:uncharacterized Zn-binding protein involved in type VI secretion
MPGVHRQGDETQGHGCWPPQVPSSWSPNVFANGKPVIRQGDSRTPHTCPDIPETHGATYTGGSTVFVNGRPIQVRGSSLSCGDHAFACSGDVFAELL